MRANPARYANKQCLKDDFFDWFIHFLPNNLKTDWNVKITKETAEEHKPPTVKPH